MNTTDELFETQRIIDRINELFISTDKRDWSRVRGCFTDDVTFDMSSLTGQPAKLTSPSEIVSGWASGLSPIEAIHHQAGNYRVQVQGNRADAFCYAIALHYRRTKSGNNTRRFVGSYDFQLEKDDEWRISLFRFNVKFVDGNLTLETDN